MSINNNEWSRVVADSLRDAEIDVSDQLWDKIEMDIKPASVSARGRIVRLLAAVAAVAILGVATWMTYKLSLDYGASDSTYIADQIENDIEIDIIDEPAHEDHIEIHEQTSSQTISTPQASIEQIPTSQNIISEISIEEKEAEGEIEMIEDEIENKEKETPTKKTYRTFTPPTKSKAHRSTMLALDLTGAGTSLSSSSLNYVSKPILHVGDVNSYDNSTERRFLDTYKNSDISHRQPFGVTLSGGHSLSNRFMVVGGVSYNTLVSDLTMKYDGEEMVQRLQFIGVPIRVDYSFLNKPRFALYGGVGGGVEYLLSAKVDDIKINDKRWHYSITGAVGAEYKFTNWLGIYAEPEIAYYLSTTKLETIRTNSPLTFTMRFGVRFALK